MACLRLLNVLKDTYVRSCPCLSVRSFVTFGCFVKFLIYFTPVIYLCLALYYKFRFNWRWSLYDRNMSCKFSLKCVVILLKIEIDSPNWQLVCHEGSNYIHYIEQSCFVQTGWHWWHSKIFCGLIYTLFKCYVHGRNVHSSFDMASFDLLFKRLKDCLTVKHAVQIISGRKDK